MKLFKPLSLSVILVLLIGCSSDLSPGQVYDEYNSKVINGISFDDDKAYYSKRKRAEVESKFPGYMERMGKTREEVIEVYLNTSRELAKCK